MGKTIKKGKKNGNGRKQRQPLRQPRRLMGVKQGSGRVPGRAFGASGPPRSEATTPFNHAFDAFNPRHLSLPRAIGQYSVVRVTQMINSQDKVKLFGTVWRSGAGGNEDVGWTNIISLGGKNSATLINSLGGTDVRVQGSMNTGNTSWSRASAVPSAFSVQIMNPEALQTSTGIVYAGRMRTMPMLQNDGGRTWDTLASEFVSYNQPRLCSAGKLALRGIQIDGVPFNMSLLSQFDRLQQFDDAFGAGGMTWDTSFDVDFRGFAPIFVYNPNEISLQYLVSTEWRVRFDPSNPAQSTHTSHPVSSDSHWGKCVSQMEACAHGAVDIVERVASAGQTAMAVGKAAGAAAALFA